MGWVEEIPGVNVQGKTLKEAKENLKEAFLLILEINQILNKKEISKGKSYSRAPFGLFIMKRRGLIGHLHKNGCIFLREGAKHSVFFFNPLLRKSSTVLRHNEIDNFLARKICRDLGIDSSKNNRIK